MGGNPLVNGKVGSSGSGKVRSVLVKRSLTLGDWWLGENGQKIEKKSANNSQAAVRRRGPATGEKKPKGMVVS